VRFTSLFVWPHSYQCQSPVRWRWGRRWKSLDTALRKVWLATDLPRQGREASQLSLVQTAIPELGIAPRVDVPAPETTLAPVAVPNNKKNAARPGCSLSPAGDGQRSFRLFAFVAGALLLLRRNARSKR
jgi:hypothetical protein